jgi:hypothetical protein
LKKTAETQTNELERKPYMDNFNFATFNADILEVVLICKRDFPDETKISIINEAFQDYNVLYKVGEFVEKDLSTCGIQNVRTNGLGIDYFKTIDVAFYHAGRPDNYTGIMYGINQFGRTTYEQNFLNGELHGHFIEYYYSGKLIGHKMAERHYVNGKQIGKRLSWDEFGQVKEEID